MFKRFGLVLSITLVMSLVCAGLVLAQSRDGDEGDPAADEEFAEETAGLDAGDPVPGDYIVLLEDEVENPSAVADDLSGDLDLQTTSIYDDAIEGFAAEVPSAELSELRADPRVEAVVQDRVVKATAQSSPTGIRRVDADQSSALAGNGTGVVDADIAVLDSGISKGHTDLNLAGGTNCTGGNKSAYSDGDGHGTHVAGTAAARDNDIGVVGVAPGARLWAVKVLGNDGSGTTSTLICGIDWVTGKNTDGVSSNDIEVANMSLGVTVSGSDNGACGWDRDRTIAALHQAVCESVDAGVFYAVAAGNERENFNKNVPASFDQVLAVTAMADFDGDPGGGANPTCARDRDDTAANFSNFASAGSADAQHTIDAPGTCIRSTWKKGGYKTISGTSMASPHVAGTAALCIASGSCPRNDPVGTMTRLRTDAAAQPASYGYRGDPGDPIQSRYYGYLVYAGDY